MDNPQPAGQLLVALPVGGPMGAAVGLGVRGGAQLALHHLHPLPHRGLEEEPPAVRKHTHTLTHTTLVQDCHAADDIRGKRKKSFLRGPLFHSRDTLEPMCRSPTVQICF